MPDDVKAATLNTSGGLVVYGVTLNDWVAILTVVYLIAQLGLLAPKYWEKLPLRWRAWFDRVRRKV